MAQALLAYAAAALLLAAGAGPILAGVRNASLTEFEDLGKPKPLDSFPFLKEMRPYLPPVVVEWLIVKKGAPQDLPPGGGWRVDDDGRIVIIWPSGCEESEATYRAGSECDPANVDCAEEADEHPEVCDPTCPDGTTGSDSCPPPLECPAGEVVVAGSDGTECAPDPACDVPIDDPGRPAHCPAPPPPQPPTCPDGYVMDYRGDCLPLAPQRLAAFQTTGTTPTERNLARELTVPFSNLSLEVRWGGVPSPAWRVTLFYADGTQVCWAPDDGGTTRCDLGGNDPLAASSVATYRDAVDGPLAAGNLTLHIEYTPSAASTGSEMYVFLYGKPADGRAD